MSLNIKENAGIRDSSTIYETGGHVKRSYLKEYVRNKINMDPANRKEIDRHLLNVCGSEGHCQRAIDEIVEADEANDNKLAQTPVGDR